MKKTLSLMTIMLFVITCFLVAQKPALEQKDYNWFTPYGPKSNNDGKFINYGTWNLEGSPITILQSVDGKWKKEFKTNANDLSFTSNSKQAAIKLPGDTMAVLTLGTEKISYQPNVISYKLPVGGKTEWIAYQLKATGKPLVLHNLNTGKELQYSDVKDYRFSENGNVLLLNTNTTAASNLILIDIASGKNKTIWSGKACNQVIMDADASHLAFIATEKNGSISSNSIWYYESGMEKAVEQLTNKATFFTNGTSIENTTLNFGKDKRQLFFTIKKKKAPEPVRKEDPIEVEIWNYKDKIFYPDQAYLNQGTAFSAVLNIDNGKVIQLTEEQDEGIMSSSQSNQTGFVLVRKIPANSQERFWIKEAEYSYILVSTIDGSKVKFEADGNTAFFATLSPGGKYVAYFDLKKKDYMCYNTATGKIINITERINVPHMVKNTIEPAWGDATTLDVNGWMEGESSVFINDGYDIWQVDLSGKEAPVNVTGGYGRKHYIKFDFAEGGKYNSFFKNGKSTAIRKNENLLLTAFNEQTKEKGFFRLQLGARNKLELLSMGAYAFSDRSEDNIKTKNGEAYIVTRMTASDAPNFFYSKDLKTFIRLTNIQPQATYNWMTSELVNWTIYGGQPSQGLLYKPENFDRTKKYPMIITYYQRFSNDLNHFVYPEIYDRPNIAYYVSNGYLVFVPDIYYKKADYMQSIHDAVLSGARELSKNAWVDSTKIGITGHSLGGYETNCLVATTPFFAAACTAAGACDMVSVFGAGTIQTMYTERGAYGIGSPIWEDPEAYIRNSPIFRANKVTTPLLIEHSKADNNVAFSQSVEFYLALRRAGKKVWMLQYDRDGHVLEHDNAKDFCIRQAQFFDHYLKGKPAPEWMTKGISAKLKGIETGLELDPAGKP